MLACYVPGPAVTIMSCSEKSCEDYLWGVSVYGKLQFLCIECE